jgi:hypothetical protein
MRFSLPLKTWHELLRLWQPNVLKEASLAVIASVNMTVFQTAAK